MAASLNGQSPLTLADVSTLQAAPPHRSMYDISAEFRRLGQAASAPLQPPPDGAEADALATQADSLAETVAAFTGAAKKATQSSADGAGDDSALVNELLAAGFTLPPEILSP